MLEQTELNWFANVLRCHDNHWNAVWRPLKSFMGYSQENQDAPEWGLWDSCELLSTSLFLVFIGGTEESNLRDCDLERKQLNKLFTQVSTSWSNVVFLSIYNLPSCKSNILYNMYQCHILYVPIWNLTFFFFNIQYIQNINLVWFLFISDMCCMLVIFATSAENICKIDLTCMSTYHMQHIQHLRPIYFHICKCVS